METINKYYDSILEELYKFCHRHSHVYIYGAGHFGQTCLEALRKRGIQVSGFITTTGGEDVCGLQVYCAENILKSLSSDSGIILAMKGEYLEEIRSKNRFPCDTWLFSGEERGYLRLTEVRSILSQNQYPYNKELSPLCGKSILVVQLEITFGDMIWSTAFYRELRHNFPNSKIVVVVNAKFISFYKNCPYIDRMIPYECENILQGASAETMDRVIRFARENLWEFRFDTVFLPRLLPRGERDSWENVLLALASRAKNRVAHAMYVLPHEKIICDMLTDSFTVLVKHEIAKHEVLQDLELLTACGYPYTNDRTELWLDVKDNEYARSVMKNIPDNCLKIAVAMVGSTKRKSWDPHKYGHIFHKAFRQYGDRIVFILCGGADAAEAAGSLDESQKKNCIDLINKTTLTEAGAVISRCDLYLGSDTGLMHMAATFGIPVIEIVSCNKNTPDFFGASPTRVGPWKTESIILMSEKGLDKCKDTCIKPYAHCINQITEEQVMTALDIMIGKSKAVAE